MRAESQRNHRLRAFEHSYLIDMPPAPCPDILIQDEDEAPDGIVSEAH